MHVYGVLVGIHSAANMFLAHDGHGHNKSNVKVFDWMNWNEKKNLVHVKQPKQLVQPFEQSWLSSLSSDVQPPDFVASLFVQWKSKP